MKNSIPFGRADNLDIVVQEIIIRKAENRIKEIRQSCDHDKYPVMVLEKNAYCSYCRCFLGFACKSNDHNVCKLDNRMIDPHCIYCDTMWDV